MGKKDGRKACVLWCLHKTTRFRKTGLVKRQRAEGIALITLFLDSLGSLSIFAIFGSILSVGGLREGMVLAVLKFQIAAGDRSCFIFSNQDGLFAISCSLAALFQTTKMRMPHVASGRGGVLLCW